MLYVSLFRFPLYCFVMFHGVRILQLFTNFPINGQFGEFSVATLCSDSGLMLLLNFQMPQREESSMLGFINE